MEVEYPKFGEGGTQMEEIHYRHEWKHELNYLDLLTIRQRLQAVMEPDPHAVDGKYLIRSLYFDNPEDKALREKIDGVNLREKFRIRYYNGDPSLIHLEKKSRRNGLGTKYSSSLSREEAQAIVDGDLDWMMESGKRVASFQTFCILAQGLGISPVELMHRFVRICEAEAQARREKVKERSMALDYIVNLRAQCPSQNKSV